MLISVHLIPLIVREYLIASAFFTVRIFQNQFPHLTDPRNLFLV